MGNIINPGDLVKPNNKVKESFDYLVNSFYIHVVGVNPSTPYAFKKEVGKVAVTLEKCPDGSFKVGVLNQGPIIYSYESFNTEGTIQYGTGKVVTLGVDKTYTDKTKVMVTEDSDHASFVGNQFLVDSDATVGDGSLHLLYNLDNTATTLKVKIYNEDEIPE